MIGARTRTGCKRGWWRRGANVAEAVMVETFSEEAFRAFAEGCRWAFAEGCRWAFAEGCGRPAACG